MIIPADIPQSFHQIFQNNYNAITKNSQNLFLFAGDHKLEKLNLINPEILFKLASDQEVGCFATHLGLIARYGNQYPNVNYIVKLNGKSNLLKTSKYRSFFMPIQKALQKSTILHDPVSRQLWSVDDALSLQKNSGLNIRGVGYSVYLGSSYESDMLYEAAGIVHEAHQQGLVAILWMYPRGYSVKNEFDGQIIAGAAGVAAELGADFAKIKVPSSQNIHWLKTAVESAGNTKIIISGGEKQNSEKFLEEIETLIAQTGIAGVAVGRNIFECEPAHAQEMIKKISALVYKK